MIMSRQSPSPSYDQFTNKLKAKFKKEKQQRKQYLRQITCRKLVESSDGSNDDEYLKRTGNRWWGRVNRHYFPRINEELLDNMRKFTTSEDMLGFGSGGLPLHHYYKEIICSGNLQIFFDDSIRVLYRFYDKLQQKQWHILAGYLCQNKAGRNQEESTEPAWNPYNLYSFHSPAISPPRSRRPEELQQLLSASKEISIELSGFTEDEEFIQKCLYYETAWRDESTTEIEKEIQCWKYELEFQHRLNNAAWDRIEKVWEADNARYPELKGVEKRIEEIKRQLIHSETFSYFRHGYSDKTGEDFSTAASYVRQGQQSKYLKKSVPSTELFETDCKICFCTKNEAGNKVIYCDVCNTSFHQSCYGIEQIDFNQDLVCDICAYRKKQEQEKKHFEAPCCQICGRSKFPIKNISGHFYHVSCLILFEFADIHEFRIDLKKGVTHQSIIHRVIENEMEQDYCQFCVKCNSSGMKFKCAYPLCTKSFHPICAYLNGCIFQISRRSLGGIEVKVECRDHTVSEFGEIVLQVYLRRYLCNYRHTASIKEETFREIYERQLESLRKNTKASEFGEGGIKRILKLKKLKTSHDHARKRLDSTRKSQSLIQQRLGTKVSKEAPKATRVQSTQQKPSQSLT